MRDDTLQQDFSVLHLGLAGLFPSANGRANKGPNACYWGRTTYGRTSCGAYRIQPTGNAVYRVHRTGIFLRGTHDQDALTRVMLYKDT
jgi:hypothetical protein